MYRERTIRRIAIVLAVLAAVLSGCTAPKAVEQTHHSRYEADTLAVQAHVDTRMKQLRQQLDSSWSERISQYTSQQQQSEHQQETVTETVTTMTDSLGREIRQEQRTISRDITREQQVFEQRLTREFEARLETAMSELDSTWQMRYDELQASIVRDDSTSVSETPVAVHEDNRPWYRRWWDHLQWLIIGAVAGLAVWITRKWWLKIF